MRTEVEQPAGVSSYLRRGPWDPRAGCRCSPGSRGRPGRRPPPPGCSCSRERPGAGVGSQSSGGSRAEPRQTLSDLPDIGVNLVTRIRTGLT